MSLQACADIVAKGDPDRFAAAMAASVAARKVLFPVYAFNVEVTKAAWIASEPMIGEMRLQWWRDVLQEISEGGPVRKHEVATMLAEVLTPETATALDKVVQARRWDLYMEAFEDEDHLLEYLKATGGALMWAAGHALGAKTDNAEKVLRSFGQSTAFTRFMSAVVELEAKGRVPLVDGRTSSIALLSERMWEVCPSKQDIQQHVPKPAQAALLEGWQTPALLARLRRNPNLVADGALKLSEFEKRARLLKASIFGAF